MSQAAFLAHGLRAVLTAVLLAGIAVGAYLARHHDANVYADAGFTLENCAQTETVDCETVNTSAWSELLGLPIAAYAIPTYLLLVVLTWTGVRRPERTAYAFSIGLLCLVVSGVLFWISKTRIGFLCLWCVRLYAVNLAIPLLLWAIAWRSPRRLLADTLADLRRFAPSVRLAAGVFVMLLAATVLAQLAYRAGLREATAAWTKKIEEGGGLVATSTPPAPPPPAPAPASEPTRPEPPKPVETSKPAPPPEPAKAEAPRPGGWAVPGPLRRLTGDRDGVHASPFDLQARLGAGRPVALLFWAPGFRWSEGALVENLSWLRSAAPGMDLFAVSGRRDDQRDEEIQEAFALLATGGETPLLVDDGFVVSTALKSTDVPSVVLFDTSGALVASGIRDRRQLVAADGGNLRVEDLVRRLSREPKVPPIVRAFPYWPVNELLGSLAPPFTGKRFESSERFRFSGKSPDGRPTAVLFWSSTCKHCQAEVPKLVAWLRAHPGAVDLVSVSRIAPDSPGRASHRAVTTDYIRREGISFPVVEDPDGAIGELYRNLSTPTMFFVSPDGTIADVWVYPQGERYESALEASIRKAAAASGGKPAQEPFRGVLSFRMTAPDGKKTDSRSTLKGPTLVHFWATWCKPCVEELPALLRYRKELEASGTGEVVFVSVEDAKELARVAAFERKLPEPLRSFVGPEGGLFDALDPSWRVPRTFVVGSKGDVLGWRHGEQDWDDALVRERIRSRLENGR